MQACRALWTGALTDFHGTSITLRGARYSPPPAGTPRFYQGGRRVKKLMRLRALGGGEHHKGGTGSAI
jgi:alkanesulfonate monooxygenase SsuD/methylene tetrahydromethanopterin reductase-like flavin-dependent oxidoreductase (luciferase family)